MENKKEDVSLKDKSVKEIKDVMSAKNNVLNSCVLGFAFIMTVVALLSFFIATFRVNGAFANGIASLYVLCMLLAAPTLKVFMDKNACPVMKKLNILMVIAIFATILIMAVIVFLSFAFNF